MEDAKTHPPTDTFKPQIDAAFLKITRAAGADTGRAQSMLDELDATELGPWHYLQAAARTLKSVVWNDTLRGKLGDSSACALFEAGDDYPYSVVEHEHEIDPDENYGEHPVVVSKYPEEAREALRQDHFWGGGPDEVYGVWETQEATRIYHASPTSFRILGEGAVDYIERVVRERLD